MQVTIKADQDDLVLSALKTVLSVFEDEPVDIAMDALRGHIKELETGKSPVDEA